MVSPAILLIGIAVTIVLFMGPLGTLTPRLTDMLTSFLNPSQQGENTASKGAPASSQSGDLSAAGGDTSSGGGNAVVKEPTKGEQQSAQQTQPGKSQSQKGSEATGTQGGTGNTGSTSGTGNTGSTSGTGSTGSTSGTGSTGSTSIGTGSTGSTVSTGTNADTTVSNPTAPFVRVMASKFILEEDYTAVVAVILGPIAGGVNPNMQISRVTMDLVFENIGDASTSSVQFDGVFHVDGLEVKRVNNDIGELNLGQKVTKQFTYTIKVSEVPPEVINRIVRHVVEGKHPVFTFEIKNINFAKS